MSADWDYAELTKTASRFGGPERFVTRVASAGFARGIAQGRAQGGVVGALVTFCVLGAGTLGVSRYKQLQERLAIEQEAAERALLNRMDGESGDDR